METIKETLDELMIEEFGDSWTKGYFEETNMVGTGEMVEKAIERTRRDISKLIDDFKGEEYTDYEIWIEIKEALKGEINGRK